jgi:hypothetical protein
MYIFMAKVNKNSTPKIAYHMTLLRILACIFSICLMGVASEAEFDWKTQFSGIVDNREYFNSVQTGRTILGGRITTDAGICLDTHHTLRIGGSLLQEYGSRKFFDGTDIFAFYHGAWLPFSFYFGKFPRQTLLRYPLSLLSDSLDYYRPFIEGTLIQLAGRYVYETIWVDWTGKIDHDVHETFLCGFSGALNFSSIRFSHYFVYYHFAHTLNHYPDERLRDNGGGVARIGIMLHPTGIDSLAINAGILGSFDRIRDGRSWQTALGSLYELDATRSRFNLHVLAYFGNSHTLLWGDSFYKAHTYGRGDFTVRTLKSHHVCARFTLSLHGIEGHIDNSEAFLLTVLLGGHRPLMVD